MDIKGIIVNNSINMDKGIVNNSINMDKGIVNNSINMDKGIRSMMMRSESVFSQEVQYMEKYLKEETTHNILSRLSAYRKAFDDMDRVYYKYLDSLDVDNDEYDEIESVINDRNAEYVQTLTFIKALFSKLNVKLNLQAALHEPISIVEANFTQESNHVDKDEPVVINEQSESNSFNDIMDYDLSHVTIKSDEQKVFNSVKDTTDYQMSHVKDDFCETQLTMDERLLCYPTDDTMNSMMNDNHSLKGSTESNIFASSSHDEDIVCWNPELVGEMQMQMSSQFEDHKQGQLDDKTTSRDN
jgi:hypothetical protein